MKWTQSLINANIEPSQGEILFCLTVRTFSVPVFCENFHTVSQWFVKLAPFPEKPFFRKGAQNHCWLCIPLLYSLYSANIKECAKYGRTDYSSEISRKKRGPNPYIWWPSFLKGKFMISEVTPAWEIFEHSHALTEIRHPNTLPSSKRIHKNDVRTKIV